MATISAASAHPIHLWVHLRVHLWGRLRGHLPGKGRNGFLLIHIIS
jgi:hypothetical protein